MVVVFGVANQATGTRVLRQLDTLKGEPMWRALRNLALKIGNNEDFRELVRGVAMVVLIVAIIVSALF